MATLPASADAHILPDLGLPSIAGAPVLGAPLAASAAATGDPEPVISFESLRCDPGSNASCSPIPGATSAFHVVSGESIGYRLAVRATATNAAGHDHRRSRLTPVVTGEPAPAFPHDPAAPDPSGLGGSPFSPPAGSPRFVTPFPVVRVKGSLRARGARITLFRVSAPSSATVDVRCERHGCDVRRRSLGPGRVGPLERFLRVGIRITIRVSEGTSLGKYVLIVVRGGRKPKRTDACLAPGSSEPTECPAT